MSGTVRARRRAGGSRAQGSGQGGGAPARLARTLGKRAHVRLGEAQGNTLLREPQVSSELGGLRGRRSGGQLAVGWWQQGRAGALPPMRPWPPAEALALMSLPVVSTAPEDSLEAFLVLPTGLEGCRGGQQEPPISGWCTRPVAAVAAAAGHLGGRHAAPTCRPPPSIDHIGAANKAQKHRKGAARGCWGFLRLPACARGPLKHAHLGGGRRLEERGLDGRAGGLCGNRAPRRLARSQARAGKLRVCEGQGLHGCARWLRRRAVGGASGKMIGGNASMSA